MKAKRATRKISKTSVSTQAASPPETSSMVNSKALTTPVPPDQLDMPAGFRSDGQVATLKEVVDPKVPTLSLAELTPQQKVDLVVKRIEQQPEFKIAMVGAGLVDKDRAIAEVKAQSKVGRALMEIEQRVLNNLTERASKGTTT